MSERHPASPTHLRLPQLRGHLVDQVHHLHDDALKLLPPILVNPLLVQRVGRACGEKEGGKEGGRAIAASKQVSVPQQVPS